jgi:PAS domain S-box-containing protein
MTVSFDSGIAKLVGVASESHEKPNMIGTTDERRFIDRVSPGSEGLIGYTAAELLGQPIANFVDEANVTDLLEAFDEALSSYEGASRRVAVRAKSGDVLLCEVLVVSLLPAPSNAFAFIADGVHPLPTTSTAQQRLARRLGGVWDPVAAQRNNDPLGIGQLTSRELEIVTLLATGHRVPSISQRLFLSQSTVRSHLSTIFRKFDVRSQSELLDLLRGSYLDATDSDPG